MSEICVNVLVVPCNPECDNSAQQEAEEKSRANTYWNDGD